MGRHGARCGAGTAGKGHLLRVDRCPPGVRLGVARPGPHIGVAFPKGFRTSPIALRRDKGLQEGLGRGLGRCSGFESRGLHHVADSLETTRPVDKVLEHIR
eukprot:1745467-Prymnesium_polylepis.3